MKESIKDDQVELEVVYGDLDDKSKSLTKQQFLELKQYLTNEPKYTKTSDSDILDIRTQIKKRNKIFPSSIRLSIEGLDHIKNYCKNDMLETVDYTMIEKTKYKKDDSILLQVIVSSEYPCRVNLKKEVSIHNESSQGLEFSKDWD